MTHARNTIFFANVQNEDNLFVFFLNEKIQLR